MKLNIFKSRRNSLLEELKKKNKNSNFVNSQKTGIFEKSSLFFKSLFGKINCNKDIQEQVEEFLINLDFGVSVSEHISKKVASSRLDGKPHSIVNALSQELVNFYGDIDASLNVQKGRTNVLLMVGPNGSGKTTSIAKLSFWFQQQGFKVLLVAGDTFRAGAVEQLKTWSERLNIDIEAPSREKEDPAALVYRALNSNKEKKYDLIICDTSGRHHNNQNLLRELQKVYEVIAKFDVHAPHETLLVMDSVMGQTSLLQAEKFLEYAKVTGIILTKMDYMSKGGIIFAIKEKFNIPVKFIGCGEQLDDLQEFDLRKIIDSWTEALLD